ncbi:choline BCCT transporter BetT [Gordonia hydrophobica]|uniref:Choline BCCT transporter BetT n=1 Tax=Gordonia hydrophobica TaxID=40516 RepID=A0ABZ2U4X3_9ACTN|nr:choline BCCT transporter BetT [Gordonia hydrophobica]MBM7369042.1 choline/glycine/proline betaine transport protein [Gordonia hydrophobica]
MTAQPAVASEDAPTVPKPDTGAPTDAGSRNIRKAVFFPSAAGAVAIAIWALVWPSGFQGSMNSAFGWITQWLGWAYILLATGALVFVVYLAVSRYGKIRIGPDHSRPEFGMLTWTSMLFAAGIGTDLMYFAVSGPLTHYLAPPEGTAGTEDAARHASVFTIFHYGINGWALYTVMGIALGYFAYRRGMPLAVRSAVYPLLGKRIHGRAGDAIDVAAVLGTIFGVSASLGIGVVLINVGLEVIFGVAVGIPAQVVLVIVGVLVATLSAVSGIDRGIKRLSQANTFLAVALTVFVLFAGKTDYLLNALVMNIGDFVRFFPGMTMDTFAMGSPEAHAWLADWTVFFWAWWCAWAAFIGMFLARISRGRTIRQFVAGVLIIPFTYILMWVSIYGNSALEMVRSGNTDFGDLTVNNPEEGFFALLQQYPFFTFIAAAAGLTALLFYVTSADSAAMVMSTLTSKIDDPNDDGKRAPRVFWAVATGLLTIAMLSVGGVGALQQATVVMAIPAAIVIVLVMISLFKALREEGTLMSAARTSFPAALSGRDENANHQSWRSRLKRDVTFPTPAVADAFLYSTVVHALDDVAEELLKEGYCATVAVLPDEETPRAVIEIDCHDDERKLKFKYAVHSERFSTPEYARRRPSSDCTLSARLVVHLESGGQGYDVMGYTKPQLINDLLDNYERYLEFLRLDHLATASNRTGGRRTTA